MKTKSYIILLLVLVLSSCKKEQSLEDQVDNVVVVNAFLEVGKTFSGVKLTGLDPIYGEEQISHQDLECEIIQGDNVYTLTKDDQGLYNYSDENVVVMADTGYELKVTGKDKILRGFSVTPQKVENVTFTKTTIDTQLIFDQIDVDFEESEGVEVFYLVRIELEDKSIAVPIDFPSQSIPNPKSSFLYNGNQSTISLLASYFEYYGEHTVTIERINEQYFDLYQNKYDQELFLDAGNIINGKGVFMGKDTFTFVVDIL